ncbi:Hsp70 family protein [Amycolatopsis sp. cg9]|uniref:Hsp70 family protein n=1 Tax=Amycolatopsis sp. cg9 TaxID=3238801 RepID=UPI0035247A80
MDEGKIQNTVEGDVSGTAVQAAHIGTVNIGTSQEGVADAVPPPYRVPVRELLADLLTGGAHRRVARSAERLAAQFPAQRSAAPDWERTARAYRQALQLALRVDPAQAEVFFRSYDARIPPERYPLDAGDHRWLAALTWRPDGHVLTVVFDVATRLRLADLQLLARDRMTDLLAQHGDANTVVANFRRWQDQDLLTGPVVTAVLKKHMARTPLERDAQLWRMFFAHLPRSLVPDLFDVRCFLGHGADAVRLADSETEAQRALTCCLRSAVLDDVRAGLGLAHARHAKDLVIALAERYADLLTEAGRFADALPLYRQIGRLDRVSQCHEELHQYFEALETCPADQPGRLAALADRSLPDIHGFVERQEFPAAAERVRKTLANLDRVTRPDAAVLDCREQVESLRVSLLKTTRRHFGDLTQRMQADDSALRAAYGAWSRFEEAAGELSLAASRAEAGGEFLRANDLFNRTGQYGEGARVLVGDDSPEALEARAESYEGGGDLSGAARLRQRIGQPERAVDLFLRAGDHAGAAQALLGWLGTEAPEDPRLAECLRRTGEFDTLVRRCLEAVEARGEDSQAGPILRELVEEGLVPPHLTAEVTEHLEALGARELRRFQERVQAWVTRARADVDRRYSAIWGFDLGTTTCAAAIYDSVTRQPVFCPWKGHPQFASTLSFDEQGTELVGLSGEEILAPWVIAHIGAAKRLMGSGRSFKVRERTYRPEEVAARMIRHARGLVETFLADQVRERVGELAAAELGRVRAEWLAWTERNHALRIDRPRVVVTIPAYFGNNQKAATRSACGIAEVDLVRLVHEPTAACIAAAWERRLDGHVAVVDLGAGTLDISLLDVGEGVYDVRDIGGDTGFGGKDFDAAITNALITRLGSRGIRVSAPGSMHRRLEVAAESLKIDLSAQEYASCTLLSFGTHGHQHLELTRAELAEMLAGQLATLRRVCAGFAKSAPERPDQVVLVGRPMLSPLVRQVVEDVFATKRVVVTDPRTAVASGAALLAATRSGALKEIVLLDVTPLALGIRATNKDAGVHFSELIPRTTTIPTRRSEIYSTHQDNQRDVHVQIFNGSLERESKIGEFVLTGIAPARRGVPQIEVSFALDADCVLDVTARDLGTKQAKSIRVADTTLLSPTEISALTRRYEQQRLREQQRAAVGDMRERLRALAVRIGEDESEAAWEEFQQRQSTHRPAAATLNAETRQALVEMFNEANQTELDLASARRSAREAAAAANDLTKEPAPAADDLEAAVAATTLLLETTEARAERLRELTAKVARWTAVLGRLAMTDPDPLRRFRNDHAAGAYPEALAALAELDEPLSEPGDLRRHAQCLAAVGDTEGYRALRRRTGATRPGEVPAGLVGLSPSGTGFLVGDRFVVAPLPEPEAAPVAVTAGTATGAAEHVFPAPDHDFAVLRLTAPLDVPPLPLGRPDLLRIGDQLWLPGPADDGGRTLLTGVVNRFEATEHGTRLFRTSLALPASSAGTPAFDDLGDVVGVAVPTDDGGGLVLSIDALEDLLREAGCARDARSAS